jgi:hypothetical protein
MLGNVTIAIDTTPIEMRSLRGLCKLQLAGKDERGTVGWEEEKSGRTRVRRCRDNDLPLLAWIHSYVHIILVYLMTILPCKHSLNRLSEDEMVRQTVHEPRASGLPEAVTSSR